MKTNKPKHIWILRSIAPHMDVVGWEYFLSKKDALDYHKSNMAKEIKCEVVKYEIKTS